MEQEIRETLEKSKKSEEYQYALKVKSTIYLEWCLSQIAELRKENERLKTCPDCGGSGVVELCHDPLYTEPCICTMDFMGENRELADEVNRLRKQIESKQDQNQGGSSKWTTTNGQYT